MTSALRRARPKRPARAGAADAENTGRVRVEVAWGDIAKVKGDVHIVGHYVGVLPLNAEWALDCAISGTEDESKLVLTDLTRRGAIRGALGDVIFFPWAERGHVVLAGMGRLGTFREPQLTTLARSLTQAVGRLLKKPTLCTVLIGSGEGNLGVKEAVSGLLSGVTEALATDPQLELRKFRIVERRLDRAYEILEAVRRFAKVIEERQQDQPRRTRLVARPDVIEDDDAGGVIPVPFGFSLMLASLAQACHDGARSPRRKSLDVLVDELPDHLRAGVRLALRRLGSEHNSRRLGLAFSVGRAGSQQEQQKQRDIADRVSFVHDGSRLRSAAITNLTTVKTIELDVSLPWVDRIVEDLEAPLPSSADDRARNAYRHLVHPELRAQLEDSSHLVLELDRTMARVPWEMIHNDAAGGRPLGVHRAVARQLRTAYSPRSIDFAVRPKLKALVIGDPDGSLAYAAEEARAVGDTLREHGLDVHLRLGPPDELRLGRYKGIQPADLYEVVGLLQSGEFDLVHYSGHAVFTPEYPDRSGWTFKGELLTPSKLEGVERPPRLIVANACLSAKLSNTTSDSAPARIAPAADTGEDTPAARRLPGDSRLVASLADEFFRRGVADYIGTAWEVPEAPASRFAKELYVALLRKKSTFGEAVRSGRETLWVDRAKFGEHATVWAAYQHYGDPTRKLLDKA